MEALIAETYDDNRMQYRREFFLALIVTGLACCAALSNLLFTPDNLFPVTADAMGHMAKVRFLAESFFRGEFPAWFPYWYNGTTVAQYYPPFSYWLLTPIYMITKNAMLSFKIYCFLMIYIGGVGVWYFCRIYICRWWGIFASVIFCIQPYILRSFFGAGLIAQGPIIALTSWYLVVILSYAQKPTAKKFFACTLFCAFMIISHPMTTFMICLCMMLVLFVFVPLKRIKFHHYVLTGTTIIFAGILTAFWSLVGVTPFENPELPYLLPSAAVVYTADMSWFLNLKQDFSGFFFAASISIASIAAFLTYAYRISVKKAGEIEHYFIFYSIILTFFTMVFSFGYRLPFFNSLPMAGSLVPGRILGLTSVTGAILCAYLLFEIQTMSRNKKAFVKIMSSLVCIGIMAGILANINPYLMKYGTNSDNDFNKMISLTDYDHKNFDKGRYSYIGAHNSCEVYFPLSYDYNICEGWNIEGTVHNEALWDEVIAEASDNLAYVAKNLAFWNVRHLYLVEELDGVKDALNNKYQFNKVLTNADANFYSCNASSSYFLIDKRNALVFGAGSPSVAIEFPYLVHEQRNDITDYSLGELEKYKLIYLCEPRVDNTQEKEKIESIVETLVNKGVTVLIEPTIGKGYSLFDVPVADVTLEKTPVIQEQPASRIRSDLNKIKVDESTKYGRALFGLDTVYYKLVQNGGTLENDIIGTKKVGNGEVIFIGKHLSQFLKAVFVRNWGAPNDESGFPKCTGEIKSLFEDIFATYGVNKDYWPDPFPVEKAEWNYRGVNFTYSSPRLQEMTLSVTYAPRWKATLDGKPIPIGQKENLITLMLPDGNHEVKLVYGLTKYGIAGYIISLAGLVLFILFLKFYDIILYKFEQISIKTGRFLQISREE